MPTTTRTSIVGRLRRPRSPPDLPCRTPMTRSDSSATARQSGHQQGQARATPVVQRPPGEEAARRDSIQAALAREPRRLVGGQSDGDVTRGIGARRQARSLCSATVSVPQRRVPNLHAGAATMVRDGDRARSAALVRRGYQAQALSLVPEFGRIPVGSLTRSTSTSFSTPSAKRSRPVGSSTTNWASTSA